MTLSVNIPFAGFYHSAYSDVIDSAESRDAEYYADEAQADPDSNVYQPEPKARLTADEVSDLFSRHADYSTGYDMIARDYVDQFAGELADRLGFGQRFAFDGMDSPREYNFTTDRLFATVPIETAKAWIAISRRADKHRTLAEVYKERFTSRDGFMSFYEPAIPRKPVAEWDHNELGALLRAVAELRGLSDDSDHILSTMYEHDYEYWQACVDWPAFHAAVCDLQAEKLVDLQAEDPDYTPPLPRCTDTLDMFTRRYG